MNFRSEIFVFLLFHVKLASKHIFAVAHILTLPDVIINSIMLRKLITECDLHLSMCGQQIWMFPVELLLDLVLLIIFIQCPFLLRKRKNRFMNTIWFKVLRSSIRTCQYCWNDDP